MKAEDRSGKSIKNMTYGMGAQLLQSIFPFISRTVFIHVLGESYLGINGLFSSILSVLSLAELGIGNVVVFSLYKPLASEDTDRLGAYVNFYKVIYRTIAAVVLGVGLILLPFIPYLVKLPDNIDHLYLYYILYVINSAVSYLYVYKSSIINADQKEYIVSVYTTLSTALMYIVQCVVLLLFRSFTGYLISQLIFTFGLNFALSKKADKIYRIDYKNCPVLSKQDKRDIFTKTKAMLSYKLGSVFLNSTDSVYISTLVSTIIVGLYTNYTILENFLNKFINILYNGLYASVGNLNATKGEEKQKMIFNVLMLAFMYIGTAAFNGYFLISSKIIEVWIGKTYCMETLAVLALALRFYMPIILYPVWMYRNTTGLFEETKGILIYAGVLNLVLSFFLGKSLGLAGILFATSISRLFTSFWYEPVVLYRKIFSKSHVGEYFLNVLFSIFTISVSVGCCLFVEKYVLSGIWAQIIAEGSLCIAVPFVIYLLRYRKTAEATYLVEIAKRKLGR